jgi:hypothetical protein
VCALSETNIQFGPTTTETTSSIKLDGKGSPSTLANLLTGAMPTSQYDMYGGGGGPNRRRPETINVRKVRSH